MRKVLGAFTLFLASVIGAWVAYNLLIERQPEARGSAAPALVLVAGFFYQGRKWWRASPTSPIVVEVEVPVGAERAFELYVHRMGEWWPATHTRDPDGFIGVTIEPEVGGRIFATFRAARDDEWGKVDTFDPWKHALAYSFTLAQPADQPPTRIEVSFRDHDESACILRFVHGGWNDANVGSRAKFRDWPMILDRFVTFASSSAAVPAADPRARA